MESAKALFSAGSLREVSVRQIAAHAGANASLISRYFGSKEDLFREAMTELMDLSALLSVEAGDFGTRALSLLTADNGATVQSTSMLVMSIADATSREIALELVSNAIRDQLGTWLSGPDQEARAILLSILAMGFTTYRVLLPVPTRSPSSEAQIRDWMIKAIQGLATPSRA